MIVNTLMNSSMTRLEEIPSISSDLLLERDYMTGHPVYCSLCRSLTHRPELTWSTDQNKVDSLVDLILTKSTSQSKDKNRYLDRCQITTKSIIDDTIGLLTANLNNSLPWMIHSSPTWKKKRSLGEIEMVRSLATPNSWDRTKSRSHSLPNTKMNNDKK